MDSFLVEVESPLLYRDVVFFRDFLCPCHSWRQAEVEVEDHLICGFDPGMGDDESSCAFIGDEVVEDLCIEEMKCDWGLSPR